jgi:hypothetical protein
MKIPPISNNRLEDGTMGTLIQTDQISKTRLWTARVMTAIVALFLLFDSMLKVLQLPPAVEGAAQLGISASVVYWLGIILLACLVVYLVPRTSIIGAILLTGYLGGAIATHVLLGSPLFSHTLFPLYVAALVWGPILLRERRAYSHLFYSHGLSAAHGV